MKVLRLFCIAAAVLLLSGGVSGPAVAGAKIVRVKVAPAPHAAQFRGPRALRHGRYHRPRWRYICCAGPDAASRAGYPYFHAPRPWHERNYLRGPDFPPVNDRIQSVLRPGPTVPVDETVYRGTFLGGPTVEQGSVWAGRFRGGPTVEQGSPWRSRIDY